MCDITIRVLRVKHYRPMSGFRRGSGVSGNYSLQNNCGHMHGFQQACQWILMAAAPVQAQLSSIPVQQVSARADAGPPEKQIKAEGCFGCPTIHFSFISHVQHKD